MIDTDARKYAIGSVLLQEQEKPIGQEDDKSASDKSESAKKKVGEYYKEWVTLGYWSKTLITAEKNYSTTELECLSVMWALKALRPYIEGTEFTVRLDYDSLRWMMTIL